MRGQVQGQYFAQHFATQNWQERRRDDSRRTHFVTGQKKTDARLTAAAELRPGQRNMRQFSLWLMMMMMMMWDWMEEGRRWGSLAGRRMRRGFRVPWLPGTVQRETQLQEDCTISFSEPFLYLGHPQCEL